MYTRIRFKPVFIIFGILLAFVSYSFITETIAYVFRNGKIAYGIAGVFGFLMLVFGIALFAFAGFMFVMNTLYLFHNNSKVMENYSEIKNRDTAADIKKELRKENFRFLLQTWYPALIPFGIAVLLIVGGALIINVATGLIY